MRPAAGIFHAEYVDSVFDRFGDVEQERAARLKRTRTNAAEASLRTITKCEWCKHFMVIRNTDPRSLAVPRFCAACQPTAITENT